MTHAPINVKRLGTVKPILMTLLNTTLLHSTLSAGNWQSQTISEVLPLDTLSKLLDNDAAANFTAPSMPTLAMTLIAARYRLEDLLNPHSFGEAYEVVYRLFVARAMAEVLKTDSFTTISRNNRYTNTASRGRGAEPVFTFFVETLLGVVSVAAMILLYLGHRCHASGHLAVDPVSIETSIASIVTDLYLGSIATLMSMTADDGTLLVAFENLNCSSNRFLQESNTRILLQCILDLDLLDG
jgi:hypothetical protein